MSKSTEYESYLIKFGQNLARIRKENGLTHDDMEIYGISRAYYGRVELGKHSLSTDKLLTIAKAFGVPVYMLFLDEEGNPV